MSTELDPAGIASLNEIFKNYLPGLIGMRFTAAGDRWIEAELTVCKQVMAPNGYLHAGTVVSLADTCCGAACVRALPSGAKGFTTIELKSNFLGTLLEGVIFCRTEAKHLGRTTQLWDAEVSDKASGKTIALFRCTQMVIWPKASGG
ncbi:MAG: PaaI family thioesterase [Pseudomonadota bacterium]